MSESKPKNENKAAVVSFSYSVEVSPTIKNICSYLTEHGWRVEIYVEDLYRETGFRFPKVTLLNMQESSDRITGSEKKTAFEAFVKNRLSGCRIVFAVDFPALDILHRIGFDLAQVIFLSFEGIDYFLEYDREYVSRLIAGCAFGAIQSRERQKTVETYLNAAVDWELLPVALRPSKDIDGQKQIAGLVKIIYSGYFAPWACLLEFLRSFNDSGVSAFCRLLLHGHFMGTDAYFQTVAALAGEIPNVQVATGYQEEKEYYQMLASHNLGVAIYGMPSATGNFENMIFSSGKIAAYLWNGLAVLTNIDAPVTRKPPFLFLKNLDAESLGNALESYVSRPRSFSKAAVRLAVEQYNFDKYMVPIYRRLLKVGVCG